MPAEAEVAVAELVQRCAHEVVVAEVEAAVDEPEVAVGPEAVARDRAVQVAARATEKRRA